MVVTPVSQAVDHPGIGMEIEDDRLIEREQTIKIAIGQPVRMLRVRLQPEEVHYVYEPNLQVRELASQQRGCGETLKGRSIAGCCNHDVGFGPLIVARPVPKPNPLRA